MIRNNIEPAWKSKIKENHNLGEALALFMSLLDQEEYFEAHEVLEEAWHPLRKQDHPLKNLVRGLINAAVAFEHLKRCKENGTRRARIVMRAFDRNSHLATEHIENADLFREACKAVENLKSRHCNVF